MNTKTFQLADHENYLQMHYLQAGRDTRKLLLQIGQKYRQSGKSAEIYTGAVWTKIGCSDLKLQRQSTEGVIHHTDDIIHMVDC